MGVGKNIPWGSMRKQYLTFFSILSSLLLLVCCENPTSTDEELPSGTYSVDVSVNDAETGSGIGNLKVLLYYMDPGWNPEFETIHHTEWKTTDNTGNITFRIQQLTTPPQICGYKVVDVDNSTLAEKAASKSNDILPNGETLYIYI